MYRFLWINGISRYERFRYERQATVSHRFFPKFPLQTTIWPTGGLRRVSVNSFGYGGSNAHCVLDDAFNYLKIRGINGKHCTASKPPLSGKWEPNHEPALAKPASNGRIPNSHGNCAPARIPKVFVWSAADEEGVRRLAGMYQEYLSTTCDTVEDSTDAFLDDLAYTLSNKRSFLPWKSYVVADSSENLRCKLASCLSKPLRSSTSATLSFVFTGQGAQWAGMGHGLAAYPPFKESLRRSENSIQALGCGWSLMGEHRILSQEKFAYIMQRNFRMAK